MWLLFRFNGAIINDGFFSSVAFADKLDSNNQNKKAKNFVNDFFFRETNR